MLDVVCFKWNTKHYRSHFTSDHVNTLQSMVERNLDIDHRFSCITDDPEGLNCNHIPLWDFPKIKILRGKTNAFRCLKLFDRSEEKHFDSDKILVLDLDVVIVNNITDLVNTDADFKIWKDRHPRTYYNSSIWLYKLGTREKVWNEFNPSESPRLCKKKGIMGSDQAWMSYALGPYEQTWTKNDGIYSYRFDLKEGLAPLPSNAKVVCFHGKFDPWMPEVQQRSPWIKDHYY